MNNEIEVGDYVRTKNGQIDIFEGTDENYMFARCKNKTYWKLDIVNHSKIKSEIVEVGDYVNGKLVVEVLELVLTDKKHQERVVFVNRDEKCTLVPLIITNKEIKSIVTKESFKEREYVF